MAVDKTNLEKSLTFCVDTNSRRVFWGDIDNGDSGNDFAWDSIELVIRSIHYLAKQNKRPIELHMSSTGGDTWEMLRLHDVIQACPCQIKFFGGGAIMSAATWIMACCDERFLYPNTTIMLHKWSSSNYGTDIDQRIDMQSGIELTDKLNQIFADNSRMPAEFWNEMTHRDLYITADEAITLGLADKIVTPKKRGNLRRARISIMNQPVDQVEMRKLVRSLGKRVHLSKNIKIDITVPKEECDSEVTIEKDQLEETPIDLNTEE
jgi:ATP-dependent Clp protease protease subunit